jgi:hypothetical protein
MVGPQRIQGDQDDIRPALLFHILRKSPPGQRKENNDNLYEPFHFRDCENIVFQGVSIGPGL